MLARKAAQRTKLNHSPPLVDYNNNERFQDYEDSKEADDVKKDTSDSTDQEGKEAIKSSSLFELIQAESNIESSATDSIEKEEVTLNENSTKGKWL